jgi:hypothetical protein
MKKLFTRTTFFWLVIAVFMAISVTQAGFFFGITHSGLAVGIGLAVALFLDLVTVVLMQAQLEARYRGEYRQARILLLFIVATCGTSTFANLAIALNDFHGSTMLPAAPLWVQLASPYVLASFPLFIIMMSVAMDKVVNARPLSKLNTDEYRADEQKRIEILKIQNEHLQMQLEQEQKRVWMYEQSKLQRLQFKSQIEQERFTVKQQRVSTRKAYQSHSLDTGRVAMDTGHWTLSTRHLTRDTIQKQVSTEQPELDSVQQPVNTGHWTQPSGHSQVDTGRPELDSVHLRMSAGQVELDTPQISVDTVHLAPSSVQCEVDAGQDILDRGEYRTEKSGQHTLNTGCWTLNTERAELDTPQMSVDAGHDQVSSGQTELDAGQWTASGKIKSVCSRKAKQVNTDEHPRIIALSTVHNTVSTGQDTEISEQVRSLLDSEPSISGRAIAVRLNISPTTANKWKTLIESEHAGQRVVDTGH